MATWIEDQARQLIEQYNITPTALWEPDSNDDELEYRLDVYELVLGQIYRQVSRLDPGSYTQLCLASLQIGEDHGIEVTFQHRQQFQRLSGPHDRLTCELAAILLYVITIMVPPRQLRLNAVA